MQSPAAKIRRGALHLQRRKYVLSYLIKSDYSNNFSITFTASPISISDVFMQMS